MKLIKIKGKLYHQLYLWDGKVHCGKLFDVNNESVFSGIIWENQPFETDEKINPHIKTLVYCVRYFKKNCFGNSQFRKEIGL